MLVRVSGSRAIQENEVIVEALKNSDSYYYQYGYESSDELMFYKNDLARFETAVILRAKCNSRVIEKS